MLNFSLTPEETIYTLTLVEQDHKTKDFQIGLANFNGELGKAETLIDQKQIIESVMIKLKSPKYIDDDE